MQVTLDNAAWLFAGACLGWAIRSSVGIVQLRRDIDKLDSKIVEIARREAQHSVAGVKQVFADHDETIRLHGERLTELSIRVGRQDG